MAETNRVWLLAQRPDGRPDMDCFEFAERQRPVPGDGEVLVRTLYMSVDPYMRGRMRDAESYAEPWTVGEPMQAGVVGEIVASNHHAWEEGDVVNGNLRWADYAIAKGHELVGVNPDLAPVSTALGVLGMPARTAYFGLLDVGDPKPGDTVVVSGAAGAVGSVVGQIARHAGCRVVGVAGSEEKISWLTDELGFDAAINYKDDDVRARVREACPDGVDVYFDNVGGPVTDAVMDNLSVRARVVICGQISLYNAQERPTGPRHFGTLIQKRARVEGILVRDYEDRYEEANERLARWVNDGTVQYRETVTDGLERAPEAFLGLFDGENIGKQLVQVAEYGDEE
ncbi:NADP-dependent oxidoreductase [Halomarina litorea]|uniref:NADP-dependent oxidoreductase n=1 Tax=Halomarina litorea TaxID=2961595 RepID=UPI0020C591E5|nr:NADP-dependent oxidoreductase [Halomarina sp. BCD28]